MYQKIVNFLLILSFLVSIGLAAKDPAYISLVGSVGVGITAINTLIKSDLTQLPKSKDSGQ
ncbi:MAG: hypothetical protein ICV78_03755 [Tolypothrix sp. Co-bin9]|nr:hypothetical protein [Tolypothrix sp. Co-bin9]